MRDSSFDMPAVERSPLISLCVTLALTMALAFVVSGPAAAQTPTTIAPVSVAPVAATTAVAVTTTVPRAGDAASTRTVNRIVAVLVGLAAVLLGLAVWFWRSTKPVPRHLDGLDLIGTRPWHDAGPAGRAALLAPVHERRGEERDDDLIVASEGPEVVAEEAVVVPDDDAVVDDQPEEVEAPTAPRVSDGALP